ncbi:MAG: O-antigen ligase family protein [Limisphaera sp.]|nr:O-antigen ligase family protein [Limisphaera sp.]
MNLKAIERGCERGLLFLTLVLLVFAPLATGCVRPQDFLVVQALTVALLGLWILRLCVEKRPELLWPPICWVVVLFTLYALGRYWTADIEWVARQEWLRVLVYASVFFVVLNHLHGQEATRTIAFTMIGLGTLISFYAIYQFVSGSNQVWGFVSPYRHRGLGTYINPNHLAGFLELVVPLAFTYAVASRLSPVGKVVLGYAGLVMLAGLVVTLSRAGWVAAGTVLLVMFVVLALRSAHRWLALGLLAVAVAAGFYFLPKSFVLKKRWELVAREVAEGRTADVRPALWRSAWELWRENPWWGIGPGHFDYRFRQVRPAAVQNRPDRVHNDYLNTLVDWGVVGATLVGAALICLLVGVVQTWPYVRGTLADLGGRASNKFAFVFGASLGLGAILIHSVADFNMHIPANALIAVTWMALLSSHLRFSTDRYWFRARLPVKVAVTLVLVTVAGYLGREAWVSAREQRVLARADRLPDCSPEQVAELQKAWAIEPRNGRTAYRLGEALRIQSFEGATNYQALAEQAMRWFEIAMRLNPYDPYPPLRYGMCLDWLDRTEEAQPYFDRAVELDPNSYYVVAHMGWHYVQKGQYASARPWFERSRRLQWKDNPMADRYLEIVRRRLLEAATNTVPVRGAGPP